MKKTALNGIDLNKALKPYANKWVALSFDYKQVFASGKTLEKTIKNLKNKKRTEEVLFMKVLPFDMAYVPTTL